MLENGDGYISDKLYKIEKNSDFIKAIIDIPVQQRK